MYYFLSFSYGMHYVEKLSLKDYALFLKNCPSTCQIKNMSIFNIFTKIYIFYEFAR